jgi:hypothetical protein
MMARRKKKAMLKALKKSLHSITSDWTKAKRQADRQNRVSRADLDRMRRGHYRVTIKDAAYEVMEQAYLKASNNGTLPANARQVMYAARPLVLEKTGGECWKNSAYFTQVLLPEFMEENGIAGDWDVVFDARGHLSEPHTGKQIGLGTLEVRSYIAQWTNGHIASDDLRVKIIARETKTVGPHNRYKFVLFVEKEGFDPLFESVHLANRYDLAIMSTKGMSVTAARQLVEDLSDEDVTILVLHDFDKSGFSILGSLQNDTRRYTFSTTPNVVDLGLRLSDVKKLGLQSEPVEYSGRVDPRHNLRENGATDKECEFLVQQHGGYWTGRRVELNAMTSRQLIDWLEAKLKAAGVKKVVPEKKILLEAYRRAIRMAHIQKAIDEVTKGLGKKKVSVPRDLEKTLKAKLKDTAQSWDETLWEITRRKIR